MYLKELIRIVLIFMSLMEKLIVAIEGINCYLVPGRTEVFGGNFNCGDNRRHLASSRWQRPVRRRTSSCVCNADECPLQLTTLPMWCPPPERPGIPPSIPSVREGPPTRGREGRAPAFPWSSPQSPRKLRCHRPAAPASSITSSLPTPDLLL